MNSIYEIHICLLDVHLLSTPAGLALLFACTNKDPVLRHLRIKHFNGTVFHSFHQPIMHLMVYIGCIEVWTLDGAALSESAPRDHLH